MNELEQLEQTYKIIIEAAQTIVDAFVPTLQAISEAAQKIYDAIYQSYLDQGAIYGENHEGLMRWMKELGEIARLEAEAGRLREHHAMLANFKRQIISKRKSLTNDESRLLL